MVRICPNPLPWNEVFERLNSYAEIHLCSPQSPPVPLSLGGWAHSNDIEKMQRWEQTVAWAGNNGCADLVEVPLGDFYYVDEPTSYTVGPMGGPMYRAWDSEKRDRPKSNQIAEHLKMLISHWEDIIGLETARVSCPLAFTGAKARRLLVWADGTARPPWGGWSHLSVIESERRTFTRFRASINRAIAPHEVDHVDFMTERRTERGVQADAYSPRR
jgi:hypothetical protein